MRRKGSMMRQCVRGSKLCLPAGRCRRTQRMHSNLRRAPQARSAACCACLFTSKQNSGKLQFLFAGALYISGGPQRRRGFLAGKDILWYTREKKDDQEQQLRDELQAIKDREEDLMLEVGTKHQSP